MAEKVAGHETKQPVVSVGKQEGPVVIALASTRRGDHVIVVTGEDKSIRVFEHDGKGQLRQISQR
jgi:tRNA (guanine-N(7)-)-methyltransferase subunit TRM82